MKKHGLNPLNKNIRSTHIITAKYFKIIYIILKL